MKARFLPVVPWFRCVAFLSFCFALGGCSSPPKQAELAATQASVETNAPPVHAGDAKEAYAQALEACSDGRQADAERMLDEFVRQFPRDRRLWFFRGVLYRTRFDYDESWQCFSRVVEVGPLSPEAEACRSMAALREKENADKAFQTLREISEDNPDDPLLLWLLGFASWQTHHSLTGVQAFEKLFKHFKTGPVMAHHTYANILDEYLGRAEDALPHRRTAFALEKETRTACSLAGNLAKQKLYEDAESILKEWLAIHPDNSMIWREWGLCLRSEGRFEEACEKLEKATQLDPASKFNWTWWAQMLEATGKYQDAIEKFTAAARLSHNGFEETAIGCIYRDGHAGTNYTKAVEYLERGAAKGSPNACACLAEMYKKGRGVPRDLGKAVAWYEKSVERECVEAMVALGLLYERGQGVPKNDAKARQLYELAANAGYEYGQLNLGIFCTYGRGGPFDFKKGFGLFKALEDKEWKDVELHTQLGCCYANGWGTPKDLAMAFRYFLTAAKEGDSFSMGRTALFLMRGFGVERQPTEAIKWYEKAASQNEVEAMNGLAWYLATHPDERIRDGSKAVKWALQAVKLQPKNLENIDTLAAAYARNGQFDLAVATQEKAIAQLGNPKEETGRKTLDSYKTRLDLYKAGKPCEETPAAQ